MYLDLKEIIILCAVLVIFYLILQYLKSHIQTKKIEHEFTSIVNHSFRTPLTKTNWFLKELEKEDLSNQEKSSYLQNISNNNNKLLEIVDLIAGIKDIKNTSSYFFTATSLRDLVENSINKYRDEINKKEISFQIPIFKNAPLLTIDLKKISFVIDAIIENAIIYTPNKGKILITYTSNKKNLILFFSDTGFGLNHKDRRKIFSKFYRNKKAILAHPDGMGLKLYLAKQIVQRHNGKIYAKSKGKNLGSTFFLSLPYKR